MPSSGVPRGPPRGPPPSQSTQAGQVLTPSKRVDEYMMPGMLAMRVAPPKNILSSQGRWSKKPGAIPMFNNRKAKENSLPPSDGKTDRHEEEVVEEEELPSGSSRPEPGKLTMAKPPPPVKLPPGAPPDKPAPPSIAPVVESSTPPPLRPAPNRNRAPPRIDPEEEAAMRAKRAAVAPPSEDAPFKRPVKAYPALDKTTPQPTSIYAAVEESSDSEIDLKQATETAVESGNIHPKKLDWTVEEKPTPVKGSTSDKGAEDAVVRLASKEGKSLSLPDADAIPEEMERSSQAIVIPADHRTAVNPADSFLAMPSDGQVVRERLSASNMALKSGRISVRLLEGSNFGLDGVKTSLDLFVKLRLGASDKFESKRSAVLRKASDRPRFNETLYFDLIDPLA